MPVAMARGRRFSGRVGVIALLLAPSTAAVAVGQEQGGRVLTLGEAVARALQHSPRLAEAQSALDEGRIVLKEARSAFRPRVVPNVLGALGGGSISNQSFGLNISQRLSTGTQIEGAVGTTSARNQLGTFYYSDTTLSVTQPLYGGRDAATSRLQSAERRVGDLVEQGEASERQVAIDVARAYYGVVAQQQVVAVAEQAVDRSRRLLDVSKAKLEIGKVSQLDVLRAEQLVREAESQWRDAQSVTEDARDQVRLLIGGAPDDSIVVQPDVPLRAVLNLTPADAVALARQHRPDLQRARREAAEAKRDEAALARPLLPRIDVKLALTRREAGSSFRSSFGSDGFRLVPFVGISMPDAGDAAELAAIESARRRRELTALEMRIEIDVRRAIRQVHRLRTGLDDATAAVDLARRQQDVARVRFERGLSNNLELASAEADVLAAESRRIAIVAALAVAHLELKATIGTLDLTHDFKS